MKVVSLFIVILACLACLAHLSPVEASETVFGSGPPISNDNGYNGTLESMLCTEMDFLTNNDVGDYSLDIVLHHTYIGDLVIKVVSPNGTVMTVMSRPGLNERYDNGSGCCGDSSNWSPSIPITFSSCGGPRAETMGSGICTHQYVCLSDSRCSYSPNPIRGKDDTFIGQPIPGTWKVCIGDAARADVLTFYPNQTSLTLIEKRTEAIPGGPYFYDVDGKVHLNANQSIPFDSIKEFAWDCDNDGEFDIFSSGPTAVCEGNSSSITLRIKAQGLNCGNGVVVRKATFNVNTTLDSPIAVLNGGASWVETVFTSSTNVVLFSNGSVGSSFNGVEVSPIVEYTFFCDESEVNGTVDNSGQFTCTYDDVGSYTAKLKVVDQLGFSDFDDISVIVVPDNPIPDCGGNQIGKVGEPITFDGSNSKPGYGAMLLIYRWYCGGDFVNSIEPTVSCTFDTLGEYFVTLLVEDSKGGSAEVDCLATIVDYTIPDESAASELELFLSYGF